MDLLVNLSDLKEKGLLTFSLLFDLDKAEVVTIDNESYLHVTHTRSLAKIDDKIANYWVKRLLSRKIKCFCFRDK